MSLGSNSREKTHSSVKLGRDVGWLAIQVNPIITPAWVRIKAYGYVYKVAPASGVPQKYLVPPYIAHGVSPTLR